MKKTFQWYEKITLRLDKAISKFFIFDIIIAFAGSLFLYILKDKFSSNVFLLFKSILSLIVIVILLTIPVIVIVKGIVSAKRGFHNLRKCDDDLFENIDFYKITSKEDYLCKIAIINLYYKTDGAVDELVKRNELYRLYARKDFLTVRNNLYNDLTTYFYSLIISIIASIFCELTNMNDVWKATAGIFAIAIMFMIIMFFKYVNRGQDGSYAYQVEGFELKLLEDKINKLEKNITVTEDGEKVLKTRQQLLLALQKLYFRTIQKKNKVSIKKDLETTQKLHLDLNDCVNYELQEIVFGDYSGFIAFSKNNEEEKDQFVSDDFRVLYDMICKYFFNKKTKEEKKAKMKPNEKHLEFLQNTISRMNQCSFHMKGWAITLASALIAVFVSTISSDNPGNKIYIYSAVVSTVLFWFLDSLYLSKERKFIAIYNDVIGVGDDQQEIMEYEIPVNKYKGWKYSIFCAMLKPSEILLYGIISLGLIAFCIFA